MMILKGSIVSFLFYEFFEVFLFVGLGGRTGKYRGGKDLGYSRATWGIVGNVFRKGDIIVEEKRSLSLLLGLSNFLMS
jgi:hypothetical protein